MVFSFFTLMIDKKIKLTLLSIVLIMIIFSVPLNNTWLNQKIFNENFSIFDQAQHLGVEERMQYRFGSAFITYQEIVRTINANNNNSLSNVLMLLPPAEYIREVKVEGYDAPEPAVFYYFTGIKGVIAKSPNIDSANWAFVAEDHRMWLKKVNDKNYLNKLVSIYKKYDR